jgi:uncharacterized protein (TIGR02118 family)
MRLPSRAAFAAAAASLLALTACNRPAEDNAATAMLDTGTAPAAAAAAVNNAQSAANSNAAGPTAAVVVLYNFPKDTAAFERYYAETHVPLVGKHAQEIGISRAVLEKFDRTVDGKKPTFYRKAELWFPSEEAMKRGMETAGFKAVAGDLANFSTNGQQILIAHETNNQ